MSHANPPSKFTYARRRDAWRVNEIEYPSGMNGCVMRPLRKGEWLIVQDPRPYYSRPGFRTRHEAALAEWKLAQEAKEKYERTLEAWARSGISIQRIKPFRWTWTRVCDQSSPADAQVTPTEFMTFEDCVSDLEATMNSAAADARIESLAEKEILDSRPREHPSSVLTYAKIHVPSVWKHYVDWAVDHNRPTEALTD